MPFDPKRILSEAAAAPPVAAVDVQLAAAIVNDTLRMARTKPLPDDLWNDWMSGASPQTREQLGVLAAWLATTSLREATIEALAGQRPDAARSLKGWFDAVAPLTGEMLRGNAFRQEEAVRKWAAAWGGSIVGETKDESFRRLDQLDYRKALAEYERAEKARKEEAERRAKAIREAEEREAAARGWRE
jgi:hypothetical protein